MEEEHSDKNAGIDWGSTYDDHMKDGEDLNNKDIQNFEKSESTPSIQEKQKKIVPTPKKSSKKKVTNILIILILLYSFFVLITSHDLAIFIPTLIICICLWQIGKSSKKKPYEYLYEEDEGKNLEIQPSYMPNTRYNQSYVPTYGIPAPTQKATLETTHSKTKIYKNFQKAAEYNTHWLNAETQTLNVDPDDEIILSHWTPLRITMKISIGDSIKNFLMLSLYFGIYALITYFVTDGNIDSTVQALFFPIVPYVLVCYRKFDKYLKAAFSSVVLMFILSRLMNNLIITAEGIPFLKYFIFIEDYFPGVVNFIVNLSEAKGEIDFTLKLLGVVFLFEFIIMVLYSIVKTRPYVSMVISRKAVFIRAKTKKSIWDIIVNIFWIILNPFNISQYKDVQNRIRYNKMTAGEGRHHDFSKIEPKDIRSLKKKKYNTSLFIALSIVIMIGGIISYVLHPLLCVLIIGLGIIILINTKKKKDKYKVIITVNRSQVEGSWILSHKSDVFQFERVPESMAKYFAPLKKLP